MLRPKIMQRGEIDSFLQVSPEDNFHIDCRIEKPNQSQTPQKIKQNQIFFYFKFPAGFGPLSWSTI